MCVDGACISQKYILMGLTFDVEIAIAWQAVQHFKRNGSSGKRECNTVRKGMKFIERHHDSQASYSDKLKDISRL